jgi:hypothetical protein
VSVDRTAREESIERGKLTGALDGVEYNRQRSYTDTGGSKNRAKNHFNTIQWRGDVRYNPYTGATAQSMHSKLSSSQPHLNITDQDSLLMPNDRIRKNMFEQDTSYEEEDGVGEEYGSGYRPALMKFEHGTIQKHTVAVTTPVFPSRPGIHNKFGSDPNLLESQLDRAGMTRPKTNGSEAVSPTKREERHSVSSSSTDASVGLPPTTEIARAYREHLLEKMEKSSKSRHRTTSSSTSPSHSASSIDGGNAASTSAGLSSKLKNITPSQMQAINVPDRAYYPRILPPPLDNKQDQSAEASHNEVEQQQHNPFLLHSGDFTTSHDVPDTLAYDRFTYSTLPRKSAELNRGQSGNIGFKEPVNGLHSPTKSRSYAQQPQKNGWNRTNELTKSLGSAEPRFQSDMPANQYSNFRGAPESGRVHYTDSTTTGSQSSTQPSSGSSSQGESDLDQGTNQGRMRAHQTRNQPIPPHWKAAAPRTVRPATVGPQKQGASNGIMAGTRSNISPQKPSVLPKPPVSKRNGSSLTPPPTTHERSTSGSPHKAIRSTVSQNSTSATLTHSPAVGFDSPDSSPSGGRRSQRQLKVGGASRSNFSDYVSLTSALFPKRVRLVRAFSCDSGEVTMSQGEEFDLHFVQSIKSAIIQDSSNVSYTIPLASVAKFSPIYDPFGAEKVAMQGFHFQTAGVLMDLKKTPHVVAATRRVDGGGVESSIEEGEVLVLNGVKNVFHGRLLKVFSLKHHIAKYIDETCGGNFTTNPNKIKMSLAEVYETSIPLPQMVQFHPTSSIQASFQSNLVLLKQFTMMKSVTATTPAASSGVLKSSAVNLSLDLNIDVHEVPVPESRVPQMRKKTQSLLDSSDRVSFTPYIDMPTTSSYMTQCALILNVDRKLEGYVAEIQTPSGFTSPRRQKSTAVNRQQSAGTQGPKSFHNSNVDSRIVTLEDKYSILESKVVEACDNLQKVSQKVDQIHLYLSKAQTAMTKHKRQLRESEERTSQQTTGSNSTRPHSSTGVAHHTSTDMANHKGSGSNSTHSKESSIDRSDSRLSSKLSSESESVDGGSSDQKSLNDDVFVIARPRSTTKPPVLPKPKDMLKRTNSNPTAIKELDSTDQQATGVKSHFSEAKKKFDHGDTATKATPLSVDTKRNFSFERRSASSYDMKPTSAETATNKEVSSIKIAPSDSIDLKHYLLDSSSPRHKPVSASSGTTDTKGSSETEFETSIEAITNDLTDWCTQVEDELTQLYNDSILSVS